MKSIRAPWLIRFLVAAALFCITPSNRAADEIRVHHADRPVVTVRTIDGTATEQSPLIDSIPDTARIVFHRTGNADEALSVFIRASGSATPGADYPEIEDRITFPAGAAEVELEIMATDDEVYEPEESVVVRLIIPPDVLLAYAIGEPVEARVVIFDNDEPVNHAPRVALVSPPNGAVFASPPELTIVASATDTDGHVVRVEFFAGGTSLGVVERNWDLEPISLDEDSHPEWGPIRAFRIVWEEPLPGVHKLTAVARDDDGAETTSASVEVTILEVPSIPVVTVVTQDAEGAEVTPEATGVSEPNPAMFTVRRSGPTATALDVYIRLGGTAENGTDYERVDSVVTIPEGESSVDVVIAPIDDDLAEGTEKVVLALRPLIVALPADIFPWPIGPYLIGRPAEAGAVILDNDQPANLPPVVELTHPHDGEVFLAPAAIQLIAAVADRDGEIAGVEFFEGDRSLGQGERGAGWPLLYKLRWNDVPAGDYAITAVATDNDGETQTSRAAEIKVVEFQHPPIVTIETVDGEAMEPNDTAVPPNPAVFRVSRDGSTDAALTVYYKLGGTAENGHDYEELPLKVALAAGESSAEIVVTPLPDDLAEGPETVVVVLAPLRCVEEDHPATLEYIVGPPGMARAVILDDDAPANLPPRVAITEPTDGEIFHGPLDLKIVVATRDADGWVGLMQLYAGDDKIGEQSLTFIQPPEPGQDQTFEFVWEDVQPGHYVLRARATDDQGAETWSGPVGIFVTPSVLPTVVSVVAVDPLAVEPGPDQDMNPGAFVVHRRGDLSVPLTVYYEIGGTADNGVDYERLAGEVTILEGRESARIPVKPLADDLSEETESVVVELVEPACIAIFPPPPECYRAGEMDRAVVRILDRQEPVNRPPRIELVTPHPNEVLQAPAEIKIVAMARDSDGHVVKVEFFADGEKIGEQLASNLTLEPANLEASAFSFVWVGAGVGRHVLHAVAVDDAGASGGSQEVPILVLGATEPPVVRIVATDPLAAERPVGAPPNPATFKVYRTGSLANELVVFYSLHGTAEPGTDYTELGGQVLIQAGRRSARITVAPVNDDLPERIETVIVRLEPSPALSPVEPYRVGWPDRACAVIVDNDEPTPPVVEPLPDRVFHLCLPGEPGMPYRLEASDNLVDWLPLRDVICEDGRVHFADLVQDLGHRFYRLRPVVVEAVDLDD